MLVIVSGLVLVVWTNGPLAVLEFTVLQRLRECQRPADDKARLPVPPLSSKPHAACRMRELHSKPDSTRMRDASHRAGGPLP